MSNHKPDAANPDGNFANFMMMLVAAPVVMAWVGLSVFLVTMAFREPEIVDDIESSFINPVMENFPFDKAESVICASYPFVPLMNQYVDQNKIKLGVQNISKHDSGAYTGEVSAQMAVFSGAKYSRVPISVFSALL